MCVTVRESPSLVLSKAIAYKRGCREAKWGEFQPNSAEGQRTNVCGGRVSSTCYLSQEGGVGPGSQETEGERGKQWTLKTRSQGPVNQRFYSKPHLF